MHTPDVSHDGEVVFLRAPGVKEDAITGIGPRQPVLYTHALSVNGAKFNDPANRLSKSSYCRAGQSTCR
jgi:hypothetical protein